MPIIQKTYRDNFAYDISKDVISKGEIHDDDVIKQSVEMILGTSLGERLFNTGFGSPLSLYMFETLNTSTGETLLTEIIKAIQRWEDRIKIDEPNCRMIIDYDNNGIDLYLPYSIRRNNIKSVYKKKIIF